MNIGTACIYDGYCLLWFITAGADMSMVHVQDLVRPLVEDESQKKERRKLDKFITLSVQQISGTQQQVPHQKHRALLIDSHCSCWIDPAHRLLLPSWASQINDTLTQHIMHAQLNVSSSDHAHLRMTSGCTHSQVPFVSLH